MYTAQDVVYYLLAATGGGAQDGEHAAVRQAVVHGVREVMQCRNWLWHTKSSSFVAKRKEAVITLFEGTSVYVQPIGVPLIDFTPNEPVYADTGSLPPIFANDTRFVQSLPDTGAYIAQISKPVIRQQNYPTVGGPPPDLGFKLYQTTGRFLLPEDLKDIDALVSHTAGTLHSYISPEEWLRLDVNLFGTTGPYHYTIMRSDTARDRWEVRFAGLPTQELEFHYTYRYTPRPIKYTGYEKMSRSGTATVSPNSLRLVTLSPPHPTGVSLVGSVIRFGTAEYDPEPIGSNFPFLRERVINKVASGQVWVDEMLSPRTNVKYCITDPIDCSPTMYTAILSACEMWYARIAGKASADAMAVFNRDLRIAMENDSVSPLSGRLPTHHMRTPRSMGWHAPLLPDIQ